MDINTLRIAVTLVSFLTFVGIILWAMDRRKNQQWRKEPWDPARRFGPTEERAQERADEEGEQGCGE